jgi:3-hydroxyacyl-CoA dehydrogenase/enoyl-CoA hydratase/3-hydroxybutyryl-CoA epimerase
MSAEVLAELNVALDLLDRDKPRALVIRSGKANGFIAGADVDEFGEISTEDGALALVRRGWDTFERLASAPYPTLALIRGFCLGGGLELARVPPGSQSTGRDAHGPARGDAGIVPGWGGISGSAAHCGPGGPRHAAHRQDVDARKAKKLGIVDESVPARIMENTVRGVLKALPEPHKLPLVLAATLNPLARRVIAGQAQKQVEKRARREHYPAPYAILELWKRYDGNALLPPPSDPASIVSLVRSPTAANLIRVFRLQERLKSLGKEDGAAFSHVHVVGRHDGRRHRGVVRVARPHRHAPGPERRAHRAGDGTRREAVRRASGPARAMRPTA